MTRKVHGLEDTYSTDKGRNRIAQCPPSQKYCLSRKFFYEKYVYGIGGAKTSLDSLTTFIALNSYPFYHSEVSVY